MIEYRKERRIAYLFESRAEAEKVCSDQRRSGGKIQDSTNIVALWICPPVCRDSFSKHAHGPSSEIVAIPGICLERTLEAIAFLRGLEDQSFLDRYNRVEPVPYDHSDWKLDKFLAKPGVGI
jgi:hypothetical protein